MTNEFSLAPDAGPEAYERFRAPYLRSLVFPMDDMWQTFADQAGAVELRLGTRSAGVLSADDEGVLLRWYVEPWAAPRAGELLDFARRELGLREARVSTGDPLALGPLLDAAGAVESPTLLYVQAEAPRAGDLSLTEATDLAALVDFDEAALGAPRVFLEAYLGERLSRRELWLHEEAGRILAKGELRRDPWQEGVLHLGVVVGKAARGRGLASGVLAALVEKGQGQDARLHASTERTNSAAQRALEKAGFRALHRLLRVVF